MRVSDVEERIREVHAIRHDCEVAHMKADDLYTEVLKAIADGDCVDAQLLCKAALQVENIEFCRWYT